MWGKEHWGCLGQCGQAGTTENTVTLSGGCTLFLQTPGQFLSEVIYLQLQPLPHFSTLQPLLCMSHSLACYILDGCSLFPHRMSAGSFFNVLSQLSEQCLAYSKYLIYLVNELIKLEYSYDMLAPSHWWWVMQQITHNNISVEHLEVHVGSHPHCDMLCIHSGMSGQDCKSEDLCDKCEEFQLTVSTEMCHLISLPSSLTWLFSGSNKTALHEIWQCLAYSLCLINVGESGFQVINGCKI
jgi:hypothetical protein